MIAVIGGGPAGLRAAEVARAAGAAVTVFEAHRAVGRKFLVAGRGGLNLTHAEPVENFPARYVDEPERWRGLLAEFGPDALRAWAENLTVDTFVGTSGRVFPRGQKAAALLRAWIDRLRANGVAFEFDRKIQNLERGERGWKIVFEANTADADAVILALGGASWPDTGSDGTWPGWLGHYGIGIAEWQPANCGWEVDWPVTLLERAEGLPLKNLSVTAADARVSGELLITRYGLEGGALYRLGRTLRTLPSPMLRIDFKPQLTVEALQDRAAHAKNIADTLRSWKFSPGAIAILETMLASGDCDVGKLAAHVKNFPIPLVRPRPIAEAISSAGGIRWHELDDNLMLHRMPGVFVAGEMIDWEAPTGGYLLQGCFSTGTRAGRAAAEFVLSPAARIS